MNLKIEAVHSAARLPRRLNPWLSVLVVTLIASTAVPAVAATGQFIAHNTPRYVSTAKNLGTENPSKAPPQCALWSRWSCTERNPIQGDAQAPMRNDA